MDKKLLLKNLSSLGLNEYIVSQFKNGYFKRLKKLIAENYKSGLIRTIIENEEQIILINLFKQLKSETKKGIMSALVKSGLTTDEAEKLWYIADYDINRPQYVFLADNLNFSELNSIPKSNNSTPSAKKSSNGLKLCDYAVVGGGTALIIAGSVIPTTPAIKISTVALGGIGVAYEIFNYVNKRNSTPKERVNNNKANPALKENPALRYCEPKIKECCEKNITLSSQWVMKVINKILQECGC